MRRLVGSVLGVMAAATVVCAPSRDAEAFCGFYVAPGDQPLYNDASMVALMRDGTRTVMSMSNNYKGPASDFAMVVPVPVVLQKENVKTLPREIFQKLEALSAPRLVEYWEQDPCPKPYDGPVYESSPSMAPPSSMADSAGSKKAEEYGVKIEAKFTVGEYNILILSATQSDGLERWLVDEHYNIPKGAAAALSPYIREQSKFFVAKVDIKKVQMDKQGVAVLSPLRFSYESQDFRLPVRLGLLNAQAKQDLLVFIVAKGKRYQAANYPNAFIPTNIDVSEETRNAFSPFYATLFDATMGKAGGRALVTEYAWETSSCDPCPSPPLEQDDVATLGADVLFGGSNGGGPGGGYGEAQGMVLTRLHTRYDATTLSDDIVFSSAESVVGGREFVVGEQGHLEKGARPDSINNFQARYAIRHAWTGPITCSNPKRGVWGGPPGGYQGDTAVRPATNLAAAPRGTLKLAAYVRGGLDDVDSWDRAAASANTPGFGAVGPRRACGCSMPGADTTWSLGIAGLLIGAGALFARRRK